MEAYIILLIFAATSAIVPRKHQLPVSLILLLMMLLMVGLRDLSIGRDTQSYIDKFMMDKNESFAPELLFGLMINLISFITDTPQVFILLITSLIYIPLFIIIRKEDINPSFALFIFIVASSTYFFETFNLIRQSIAIVFLLYVYHYFKKEKYFLSLIFSLVSIMFHVSSIILIPFILMKYVKLSYIWIVFLLVFSYYVGLSKILFSFFDYISLFDRFADYEVLNRLAVYVRYSDPRTSASTFNLVGMLAHMIPLTVTSLLVYKKNGDQTYFNIFFAGVILFNCFVFFRYAERLFSGLTILQIFLIPGVFESGSKIKRILIIAFLVLLSFVFIYYRFEGITDSIDKPYYKFFFQ